MGWDKLKRIAAALSSGGTEHCEVSKISLGSNAVMFAIITDGLYDATGNPYVSPNTGKTQIGSEDLFTLLTALRDRLYESFDFLNFGKVVNTSANTVRIEDRSHHQVLSF